MNLGEIMRHNPLPDDATAVVG